MINHNKLKKVSHSFDPKISNNLNKQNPFALPFRVSKKPSFLKSSSNISNTARQKFLTEGGSGGVYQQTGHQSQQSFRQTLLEQIKNMINFIDSLEFRSAREETFKSTLIRFTLESSSDEANTDGNSRITQKPSNGRMINPIKLNMLSKGKQNDVSASEFASKPSSGLSYRITTSKPKVTTAGSLMTSQSQEKHQEQQNHLSKSYLYKVKKTKLEKINHQKLKEKMSQLKTDQIQRKIKLMKTSQQNYKNEQNQGEPMSNSQLISSSEMSPLPNTAEAEQVISQLKQRIQKHLHVINELNSKIEQLELKFKGNNSGAIEDRKQSHLQSECKEHYQSIQNKQQEKAQSTTKQFTCNSQNLNSSTINIKVKSPSDSSKSTPTAQSIAATKQSASSLLTDQQHHNNNNYIQLLNIFKERLQQRQLQIQSLWRVLIVKQQG